METIRIHCEAAAKLNFACHQNAYAVLRDLRIENLGEEGALEDLTVTISSDPAFLKPICWQVDRIDPQGIVPISFKDLEMNGQYLVDLPEAVRGTLAVRVEREGELAAEYQRPIELLAPNEWGGAGYMPELLAAFCMPNDPAVDRILHDASLILRRAGKPDTIDGYESGSRKRVWEIAGAIYAAVANIGLSYAMPPASFEKEGQKIRLPGQILQGGVATCLDSTLLFAAAFEQAGLNPLVVLLKGHALVGTWLQPEKLASITNDEAEVVRKRHQLNELLLIETTLTTSHPAPPFSSAVDRAKDRLLPEHDADFLTAVDIARARAHRLSPLGLRKEHSGAPLSREESIETVLALEEAPSLPDFDQKVEDLELETPEGRLERWQRKLLDLSARNPLLSHRSTKSSLRFLCPDPGLLEDKLAAGAKVSIAQMPVAPTQEQDRELHGRRTGEDLDLEYANDAMEQGQVLVDLPKPELDKRLVEIYRRAQSSLQESGANTLFLALGFLLWKRDERDERRFRAPLILMPVSLQRKSVRSGVKMLAHDDEPRFNTTLLEMLRRDFGINIPNLDGPLPQDKSGVDVEGIWNTVRRAVVDSAGFEVVEDVVLGHFSFAKYLMWKDLADRAEALRMNPVVRHLIDTPRDPYPSDVEFVATEELDTKFRPTDFLAPLPADSSQMAAVASADRGKDFIIIGPPGTGKSQTISNLIAHLIGKEKTVLFVSEKTAALDVVYRRLDELGLGRFCLELHSNKARKTDVLNQLQEAWEIGQARTEEAWEREGQQLEKLRDRLNLVVNHLHREHPNGLTAHYAIGLKVREEGIAGRVRFSWPSADQHSKAALSEVRETVGLLQVQAREVGDFSESPFQIIDRGDWSPSWEGEVIRSATGLAKAARTTEEASAAFGSATGLDLSHYDLVHLEALGELAEVLQESFRKQIDFALDSDGQERIEALERAVAHLKAYLAAQSRLSCSYDQMAWRKLDGEELKAQWELGESSWFLKRLLIRRAVRKALRLGGAKGKPDPAIDISLLIELRKEGEAIDRLDKQLQVLRDWDAHQSDPDVVDQARVLAVRVRASLGKLSETPEEWLELRERIGDLLKERNDLLASDAPVGRAAVNLLGALTGLNQACSTFEACAGKAIRERFVEKGYNIGHLRETADQIIEQHAELHHWCGWQRRRNEAIALDLLPLVKGIEDGTIPVDEIQETFDAAYCSWWSEKLLDEDEVLRRFSSAEHQDVISKFREVDEAFQRVTAKCVAARLSVGLPGPSDVPQSSQWGLLKREITKRARHKPVRQLMNEAPSAVTRLAPCIMMSPLSVAQYLSPEQSLFDVVIFDEASQITVWDAVGSIARGKQVIVAGDPKQMPPTNFFARADDDADGDIDYDGDLESILDELRSSNLPERVLNLHYRSRRESLIAFSNDHYYDNRLVTFPAPEHPDHGLRLVSVEGFYDRGKSRTNEAEARAIVSEIVNRLTSSDPEVSRQSIGVVTFNSEQQSLIQDLLDRERSRDPGIEWAFAEEHLEPVFVKNLETVQGDERDVILFSITYGPDRAGTIYMNFGPLNREGGERRLNVAMTRARSEMVVFSTLDPDRIDLSRTSARAVADLKHFLEYAQRGREALGAVVHGSLGDFESPFESAVASALREKGWTVHPQIGVSAFRVDLGIVHPEFPGVYLAGVECDGAMYHSAVYARERDKIRQAVLEGLGWTLFRVWSTDWWINKASELERLDKHLRQHLEGDRVRRAMGADGVKRQSEANSERLANQESVKDDLGKTGLFPSETSSQEEQCRLWRVASPCLRGHSLNRPSKEDADIEPEKSGRDSRGVREPDLALSLRSVPYALANPTVRTHGEQLGEMNPAKLVGPVTKIVEIESPVHIDDVVRRITHAVGLQRAGARIQQTVMQAISRAVREEKIRRMKEFLWRFEKQDLLVRDRSGFSPQDKKFDRVALEEVAHAIAQVVKRNFSLSKSDAISGAARDLGFQRVTSSMKRRFREALEMLKREGIVEEVDELLHMRDDLT